MRYHGGMNARYASALVWLVAACSVGDESPIKSRAPSVVAKLAAQACACTTLECLRPLQARLEGMGAAQHADGNAAAEQAEAKAKIAQCAAKLGAK